MWQHPKLLPGVSLKEYKFIKEQNSIANVSLWLVTA